MKHEDIDHTGLTGISSGAVATDAIWDTKGDLAAATGANAASKLAAGANDTVLTADSAQSTGLKYAVPKLLTVEYTISGNITLTTAGSYYQGPTGTPSAGTYLCLGLMSFFTGGTGNRGFTSRIAVGGSVASGILTGYTGYDDQEVDAPSASGNMYQCFTKAIVTLNGSEVISLIGSSATASVDIMRRDPQSNTPLTLHRATSLTLVRIGA